MNISRFRLVFLLYSSPYYGSDDYKPTKVKKKREKKNKERKKHYEGERERERESHDIVVSVGQNQFFLEWLNKHACHTFCWHERCAWPL